MKNLKVPVVSTMAVAMGVVAAAAQAGSSIQAEVDQLGGPVIMNPRSLGNMFQGAPTVFTDSALAAFNAEVQASSIATDGRITFLFSETDQGLSWVALVDDENQPGDFQSADSIIGMSSTGPISADIFVNDDNADISTREDLGNGSFLATGFFEWDSVREGDGFAWTQLQIGDFVSFVWTDEGPAGLSQPNMFQFLSWNGSEWEIAATADYSSIGQFAFSFTIIPAPGAVAVLGLGGLLLRRQRRTH